MGRINSRDVCYRFFQFFPILLTLYALVSQASGNKPQLVKRQGFPFGPSSAQGAKSQKSSGPPQDPSPALKEICHLKPLVPQTWATLQLDNYLRSYPGGRNITVSQFAASKGLPNFQCGIGEFCNAGQPCFPVPPPDWYILFAVQQWNVKLNSMRTAISYGMSFVKSTMSSMLAALVPAIDTTPLDNMKVDYSVNGALTMCSNTVILDIFSLFYSFQDATGDVFNIVNNVMGAAFSFLGGLLPSPRPPEAPLEAFSSWSHLEKQMAEYEQLLTGRLANETARVEEAGISTDDGIYGQLKGGKYLTPVQSIYLPWVEDDLKNVTMAVSLVKVLRTLDAFVTIGQDVCNHDGPDGAYFGDDYLSYCDRHGTMYNIIRVKEHKEVKTFQNAWTIQDRFGYSTQLLTNSSWSCQQKYGGFEPFPYTNYTLPRDVLADCIINLPVCDCRDPQIKKDMKKHGVVKACRHAGLPI